MSEAGLVRVREIMGEDRGSCHAYLSGWGRHLLLTDSVLG